MGHINRRDFVVSTAALAGAAVTGSLDPLVARAAIAQGEDRAILRAQAALGDGGYGPLAPVGAGHLSLPEGFQYRLIGVEGSIMSDGKPTPKAHDGMAAFALPNGNIRLIRNHEDRDSPANAVLKGDPAKAYDVKAGGGTTSLEVDPVTREVIKDFVSLSGTWVNCAGGPTPWGTWVTCEETTAGEPQGWTKSHGYVFEVPALAETEVVATPLKGLGRFVHEAIAVDPETWIVYLTEDRGDSGFYRFLTRRPPAGSNISPLAYPGGKLQQLVVRTGRDGWQGAYDTRLGQTVGKKLPVRWVDIDDVDPAIASVDPNAVQRQGLLKGGAVFSRLEGCWWGNGKVYFQATDGGDARLGQIWEYDPKNGGSLTLLFESTDIEVLDGPDNLAVSPRGGLVICEDGESDNLYVRGLTKTGQIFDFAQNLFNNREFAGACFSPDGQTLFVNVQGDTSSGGPGDPGLTFAIWGPWEKGAL